jgi:hypothetical protein
VLRRLGFDRIRTQATVLTYEWFDIDADKSLGPPSTSRY